MTDFYGGEGESDGFPPGGFPGGENSIMMAGSAAKITNFDGWMLCYMWSKIKNDIGRFDLSNAQPEPETEPVTPPYEEPTSGYYMGDINHNGQVDVADVILLQKWLLIYGETPDWVGNSDEPQVQG